MSKLSDTDIYCDSREEWESLRKELGSETLERQAVILATNPAYWENALHWMGEADDVKKSFMDAFMESGAVRARLVAAMGLSATRKAPGKFLVKDARDIRARMDAGDDCDADISQLGMVLVNLVCSDNHKALADAASFLKGDHDDPKKGAFAQAPGDVWKAFCQYHIQTGSLPTKGKLDELAGVDDGRKIRGPLGLNGLPERL